ncbi:MAG: hypothetical protein LBS44_01230, partial [Deltaproteobacteria bacterium]|nr:hypothetical protein [Deltaproteobacteria bacterium]
MSSNLTTYSRKGPAFPVDKKHLEVSSKTSLPSLFSLRSALALIAFLLVTAYFLPAETLAQNQAKSPNLEQNQASKIALDEGQKSAGQARNLLEQELDSIKKDFEQQILGLSNQKQISALALKAAGQAWLESAVITDQENELFDPADSLSSFEGQWKVATNSWAAKEGKALRFYFEAFSRLTARLAVQSEDQEATENLADLLKAARSNQKRQKTLTVPAIEAETKVLWSNRLCALATILGSLSTKPERREQINDLVEDLL